MRSGGGEESRNESLRYNLKNKGKRHPGVSEI